MANVQSGMTGKMKANAAAAAIAAAAKAKPVPAPAKEITVPKIKASAMSKDVGPAAVIALFKADQDVAQATALTAGAERKRYDTKTSLTLAIVKAATADKSIDLTATAKPDKEGKAAMSVLNDQLGIALGLREVVDNAEGKPRVVWSKAVRQYFPLAGEDRKDPAVKRKETFRGNFVTQLKNCALVALGILDNGMTAKANKEHGTLQLSGPAVKKQFGMDNVLLNETKVQKDAKGKEVELAEKASFTAIAAKAKEDHGGTARRGSNTRGAAATAKASALSPDKALAGICSAMVDALQKVKTPSAAMVEEVRKVENAIDQWLGEHGEVK